MAAQAWQVHDKFKKYMGDATTGPVDMDLDSFKIILCRASTNVTTTSVDAYTSVTAEVSTANGYTQGTKTLTNPAWTEATGTVTWDESGADPVWTASGGSIVARVAAIYDDTVTTPVADPVVCSSSLSTSDVTATDGNTFTITMHASGIFTLA
jgi:hypothetical protein